MRGGEAMPGEDAMPGGDAVPGGEAQAGPRAWKLLLPWGVLPLALAIVVLADWLSRARRHTRRKEAA